MKWINKFEPLIVRNVDDSDMDINIYDNDVWVIKENNRDYLMIKRIFRNKFKQNVDIIIKKENANIEVKTNNKIIESKLYYDFGDRDSFILDMNGIDNFRFATSQIFNDYTIRKIVKKLQLLSQNTEYLRIGAAGARENGTHPGGEVLEYSIIKSNEVNGFSQNVSGYLPNNESYSKSIPMYDRDNKSLLEERTVYSHTAWLKKSNSENSKNILLKIYVLSEEQSLLDIINDTANELGLNCYAIQIYLSTDKSIGTKIKGRVLKHIPQKAFKDIPEVVEISYEKKFDLSCYDKMYGFGTKYERYEPEWKEFTNGGKYERRGHIHSTIISEKESGNKKHETFHLRDIFVSPSSEIEVILTPIDTAYRIYPIHLEKNEYICDASKRNIKDVISDIKMIDKKI